MLKTIDVLIDIDFVLKHFAAGLRPEPDLMVSEWADANRKLSQRSSAEPGAYRTDRTPYLREIMDSLSARSPVEEVVVMKSAQIGATEAGNNWLGYVVDHAPGPMLAVQPTTEAAKRFSKMRLASMIKDCPSLREKIRDARSRDSGNTTQMKEFPGGVMVITGANSAVGLRSMPVRYLFLDEIDAYPGDVDNEGDPLDLAEKRTATFRNRKIFKISTPIIKGSSKIEAAYLRGDQRGFYVPCPLCDYLQVLHWGFGDDALGGLVWPAGKPEQAQYRCESCSGVFAEHTKTDFLRGGEWKPRATSDPRIRSYHISALYSPYGWPDAAWPVLAKRWVDEHKDPAKLKVFFNLQLGLPWEDRHAIKVDADVLMNRREVYEADVPTGVALLTAGVDVQDKRLECEVVGWGIEEESWSIAHYVIPGDTSKPEPWQALDQILKSEFVNEVGVKFGIRATCVDTGYHTEIAAAFCAPRFQRKVWAIRGRASQPQVWPRRPTVSKYHRAPLFNLGVDPAKDIIYSRLAVQNSGPGYSHFPIDRDKEYFSQMTAEVCIANDKNVPSTRAWKKKVAGSRNEALDIRVYAYGALSGLKASGLNLNREAMHMARTIAEQRHEMGIAEDEPAPAHVASAPPPPPPSAVKQRRFQRSAWMGR